MGALETGEDDAALPVLRGEIALAAVDADFVLLAAAADLPAVAFFDAAADLPGFAAAFFEDGWHFSLADACFVLPCFPSCSCIAA